jgi:hypothetical protein
VYLQIQGVGQAKYQYLPVKTLSAANQAVLNTSKNKKTHDLFCLM